MGYNKKEKKEVRIAYLRMMLRLHAKLDDARLALIMSVADLYFDLSKEEEAEVLLEMQKLYPKEGEAVMELMPAWTKWAREEGKEEGKQELLRKLMDKGFSPEALAEAADIPVDQIRKLSGK